MSNRADKSQGTIKEGAKLIRSLVQQFRPIHLPEHEDALGNRETRRQDARIREIHVLGPGEIVES